MVYQDQGKQSVFRATRSYMAQESGIDAMEGELDSALGDSMDLCGFWLQDLSLGVDYGSPVIISTNGNLERSMETYKQEQYNRLCIQDEEGDTELHSAIIHNNPNQAVDLISCSPDSKCLDVQNYLHQTPLHLAVITKLPIVVRRLIIAGASLELLDYRGNSALHIASIEGNVHCAHALMTPINYYFEFRNEQMYVLPHQLLPQNLEITNFDGKTCLHLAVENFIGYYGKNEHLELISLLINGGSDINSHDMKSGRTILHYAAQSRNLPLLEIILKDQRVEVNAMDYDGNTAIAIAAGKGHKLVVMKLLDRGADVHTGHVELADSTDEEITTEEEHL